jgi:hypothetical protein
MDGSAIGSRFVGIFPIAVDLLTNELDGLGAASHYSDKLPKLFPRFQTELDRLHSRMPAVTV